MFCKLVESRFSKVYHPVVRLVSGFSTKYDRLNWDFLCDPDNTNAIRDNIKRRKGVGNIDLVLKLKKEYNLSRNDTKLLDQLSKEALRIPNSSHPALHQNDNTPRLVKTCGVQTQHNFPRSTFESLASQWSLTRTDTSLFTGPRSYYLIDQLADLENALVNYSVEMLRGKGFQLVSVPDILPREIIEDCGMDTQGPRSQVYSLGGTLENDHLCLSGTAEMGISSMLKDKSFKSAELPLKIAAVSRCFRAETSKISEEKGIYRVHQFTKVEMYGVFHPNESERGLTEFIAIQEEFFTSLGLSLRVLDMPESELGAQAFRKFDVEADFPGKKMWGELSSASDCTDYQSRRLNITYDSGKFVHTINGTACAVPRTIVALVETHQREDGTVDVPKCLVPYLGYDRIGKSRFPKTTPYKPKKAVVSNKKLSVKVNSS